MKSVCVSQHDARSKQQQQILFYLELSDLEAGSAEELEDDELELETFNPCACLFFLSADFCSLAAGLESNSSTKPLGCEGPVVGQRAFTNTFFENGAKISGSNKGNQPLPPQLELEISRGEKNELEPNSDLKCVVCFVVCSLPLETLTCFKKTNYPGKRPQTVC